MGPPRVPPNTLRISLGRSTPLRLLKKSFAVKIVLRWNSKADPCHELVTKSGTNSWHGSAFEFHRNTIFTANDFFNNRSGVERPKLIRNVFGGTLGGPI